MKIALGLLGLLIASSAWAQPNWTAADTQFLAECSARRHQDNPPQFESPLAQIRNTSFEASWVRWFYKSQNADDTCRIAASIVSQVQDQTIVNAAGWGGAVAAILAAALNPLTLLIGAVGANMRAPLLKTAAWAAGIGGIVIAAWLYAERAVWGGSDLALNIVGATAGTCVGFWLWKAFLGRSKADATPQ